MELARTGGNSRELAGTARTWQGSRLRVRQETGKVPFVTDTQVLRLAEVRAVVASGEAEQLRTVARLSIGEVARACGVDQSTVWRWERGTRRPRGEAALLYGQLIDRLRKQVATAPPQQASA
ncbi:helix-turn-helix domain-containing protein [Streptomyces sp. B21-083]|uniref:helix-turn-helix domain-containing protein n=1 Tax=Streptomyces sp. B21-083 TaxID=3039410 RepID=UPI003FA780B2